MFWLQISVRPDKEYSDYKIPVRPDNEYSDYKYQYDLIKNILITNTSTTW